MSGAAKRKRKKDITDQLSQQQDDLCDWYWENTFFYDKMNRVYWNADKKKAVTTEKARSLNLTYDDLMKYFTSLRMQYGKLKLKKSGQAAVEKLLTHHPLWVLYNYALLGRHIITTATRQLGNVSFYLTTIYKLCCSIYSLLCI